MGRRGIIAGLVAVYAAALFLACVPDAGAFVYWANQKGDTIGRATLDGTGLEPNFIPTGLQPCGVAVDHKYVYWANGGGSTIGRATLDGTDVDPNFISGLNGPCGPSLNTTTGTIYWANTGTRTIGRATLKGTQVNPSFIPASETSFPSWTTDFGNQVYWNNKGDGSIWRASDTDGSGAQDFIPINFSVQGLGVLLIPDSGTFGPAIYWTSSGEGRIGEADLVGGSPVNPNQSFMTDLGFACGLATDGSFLYWGGNSYVGRSDLDGSSSQQFIPGTDGACGVAVDEDQADASLTPSNFNFDGVLASGPPATQDFTLSNSADTTVPLVPDAPGLVGPDADQYSITADDCPSALAPGASCTITVSFHPASLGGKAAQLVVDGNDPSGPARAALFGTGTAIHETVSPTSIDFGGRLIHTTSAPPQVITLTNGPGASSSDVIDQVVLGGADASQFQKVADGCSGATVPIGGSCQVSVAFAPTHAGDAAASLAIPSDDPTSPATVSLTGTGTQPDEDVSPGALAFGSLMVGSQGTTQGITVANSADGTGPLEIGGVSLVGASPGDFDVVFDGCSGQSISPGGDCQIGVRFAPGAAGPQDATVEIASNGSASPAEVSLSGSGVSGPSNSFSLTRPRFLKHGRALLPVDVPGAGQLALGGKGVRSRSAAASGAGTIKLLVVSTGKLHRRLQRKGKARVHFAVTFTPAGGAPSTITVNMKLVERPGHG